jgi:hypothetical protein
MTAHLMTRLQKQREQALANCNQALIKARGLFVATASERDKAAHFLLIDRRLTEAIASVNAAFDIYGGSCANGR